ncbi:MAG: hypothetical protein ABEJ99_02455 [Candidatus Nanohaloarchaea archaeon]
MKLVVNGHLHENDRTDYHNIPHITLNAFSKETCEKPITGTYATMRLGKKTEISVNLKDRTVKEYTIE